MSNKPARAISYLLHPMVYPILGTLVILKLLPFYVDSVITILALVMVLTGTYIIPIAISFLFYKLRIISSLEMNKARDRRWPYLIGAISYYFTASYIRVLDLPPEAYSFLLASALVIIIHLSVLHISKLSAHLAGIGGFTGLLIALSLQYQIGFLPLIALCFLLAGFLGSARLKLHAHSPVELVLGYVSGLAVVSAIVFFL